MPSNLVEYVVANLAICQFAQGRSNLQLKFNYQLKVLASQALSVLMKKISRF